MARVTHRRTVDAAQLAEILTPRDDFIVLERAAGDGVFELADGPFRRYRRSVATRPAGDGNTEVTETYGFRMAIPMWSVVYTPFVRHALRQERRPVGLGPWWAPPDRFDQRASNVIGLLCLLAVVGGYLGTLLSQTITFAADEFDAGTSAQGATLAAVRVGVILTVVVTALADRRGRRPLLLGATLAAVVVAATTALAPSLALYGVSQTVARGLTTGLLVLVAVMAMEETPRNSRAYVASVLTLSAALGAGGVVWILPIADLALWAWRVLFVVPLAALPAVLLIGRVLPETKRFVVPHETPDAEAMARRNRRFVLLAVSAFLVLLFAAPISQFRNEFLRDERGFSAAEITLLTITINTPGFLGIVIGGRLADRRGRRLVGSIALVGGTLFNVLFYASDMLLMWTWGILANVVGEARTPALGVYGPELFGTSNRGRANGLVTTVGVAGSSLGLVLAGVMADVFGSFGPGFALLAIGPAIVAVLILTLYPETAHQRLEDINPEDRGPSP